MALHRYTIMLYILDLNGLIHGNFNGTTLVHYILFAQFKIIYGN